MNVLDLVNFGAKKLRQKKIVSSKLDSEILLSKILNKEREALLINLDQEICERSNLKFKELINRRSLKEPVAYIIEEKEFWSKNFFCRSRYIDTKARDRINS